ncbi:TonB-dependent receptor plug domain-containing protein [Flavobacterium bizetiae]|uniref:TonB-dependent receptor plug domain-containing protein n=1 Tax=Flavobacterium bizetiae TaxID=2704140 RepID=UPI00375678E0
MKNIKFISLAFSMLICFVAKAQEKTISKEPIEKETKPFTKIKDTISGVKVPSNLVQNKTSTIRIVCAKSISNVDEPLYILNGTLISANKFSKVNPNDIESIKVLKGIEATSIYGSNAMNGVIIITLKEKE